MPPIYRLNQLPQVDLSVAAVTGINQGLTDLGYLGALPADAPANRLSTAAADALKTFATRYGIGIANRDEVCLEEILQALQEPHCGVPDDMGHWGPLHISAYGQPGNRWSRGSLTYSVSVAGSRLSQAEVDDVMAKVFGQWQAVCPFFSFTQLNSPTADIQVRFGGTNLDSRFGTSGGVLGVGAYPETGTLSLDSAEAWTVANLLPVALHEAGHVLGIAHSNSRTSVMYPFNMSLPVLDAESIEAIQNLYDWQPPYRFPDRASQDAPALATAGIPNFAGSNDSLYMAWKGVEGDSGIFWSSYDGRNWTPQVKIEGIGSSHGPALASFPVPGFGASGLMMAWKGTHDDHTLYYALCPSLGGWTNQVRLGDRASSGRPALAYFNGQMVMAWKGTEGDSGLYWSTFSGGNWSAQQAIVGRGSSQGPALAVLGNRLYMFWRGIGDDHRLFSAWIDTGVGAIWQEQHEVTYVVSETGGLESFNVASSGAPAATARGNEIMMAWKGTTGDNALWFSALQNDEWSGQIAVPNAGSSNGPALGVLNGRLCMAWKGSSNDSALYFSILG